MKGFRRLGLVAVVAVTLMAGCHSFSQVTKEKYVNEKDEKQSLELTLDKATAKSVAAGWLHGSPLRGEFVLKNAQGSVTGRYVLGKDGIVLKANGKELKFSAGPHDSLRDESGQAWKRTSFELIAGIAPNKK